MHIEILKVSNPNKLWHYNQTFISEYLYHSKNTSKVVWISHFIMGSRKLREPFNTFLSHSGNCGSITGSALTFPLSDCHMVVSFIFIITNSWSAQYFSRLWRTTILQSYYVYSQLQWVQRSSQKLSCPSVSIKPLFSFLLLFWKLYLH